MARRKSAGAQPADMNAKQAAFVREYLLDLNATQAAIRAGYSPRTAEQQGSRLLSNVKVAEAVQSAQAARSERTEIDANWVLTRLADEATADLADILDEAGVIKPVRDWPLIWRQGLVAGIDVQEDTVEGVKVGQTVKIKLSDRIRRIELIGKHIGVGAFRERLEHTGKDGGPIQTETTVSDDLRSVLDAIAGKITGGGQPG